MKNLTWLLVGIGLWLAAVPAVAQVGLQAVFPALTFTRPTDLQNAGDGSNRLFVVEKSGIIKVFKNDSAVTSADVNIFLNIEDKVEDIGNEQGLLGLAFHPDYENNGYFYVNYTAESSDESIIARYRVSPADSNIADPNSELILMTVFEITGFHNGGAMAFGPGDGYLYIATGDDASGNWSSQNLEILLSKILRIDVDNTAPGLNYAIPPDNPFAGNTQGWREETYAYGFRNPWRFSIDPVTGWIWVADVGQADYEEIDLVESGKNYGWNIMEGPQCYNPPTGCDTAGLTLPLWAYDHSQGCSVTGGYVYRGNTIPALLGKYIYTDYCSMQIWALEYDGVNPPVNTNLLDTDFNISSFGIDENNELYILAYGENFELHGKIYRLKQIVSAIEETHSPLPRGYRLDQNYPNPFNSTTQIQFSLPRSNPVTLKIFNLAGKEIATLVSGQLAAGEYQITWEAANLPSGVYWYHLNAGEFVQTRKMVLAK